MGSPKVDNLILALLKRTRAGSQRWEDVSDPDEEMFRTVVGDGLVRMSRRRDAWRDESGIPRSMTHVTIWVFGSHGQEIAEVDYTEQTTFLATVEELFEAAKAQARNSTEELDHMLASLGS
ncbi:MAG: hypothetical protein U0791_19440 [Gemmataceae bacterium]